MTVQRHERRDHYHLAVHCGFCGQAVLPAEDEEPVANPCPHTLYVAHDEGFEYLSDRAESILREQGYSIARGADGLVEVSRENDDDLLVVNELTDGIELPDVLKVVCYAGAPAGFATYVGFAPLADE